MIFSRFMKVFTVISCLTATTVFSAWASSPAPLTKDLQGLIGDQAVVSMVSQDKVTLKSSKGELKEITLTMNNAKEFKIGDKVNVQGNIIKRQEAETSSGTVPAPVIHPGAVVPQ